MLYVKYFGNRLCMIPAFNANFLSTSRCIWLGYFIDHTICFPFWMILRIFERNKQLNRYIFKHFCRNCVYTFNQNILSSAERNVAVLFYKTTKLNYVTERVEVTSKWKGFWTIISSHSAYVFIVSFSMDEKYSHV